MTARRRLFSLLASVLLIVPVLVAIPAAALAQTSYQLNLSLNPDRSAAIALEGATVSGDMFVFTGPDDDVDVVRFWIDDPTGTPFRTESIAPFDLAGTNDLFGGTDAAPFDSTPTPPPRSSSATTP